MSKAIVTIQCPGNMRRAYPDTVAAVKVAVPGLVGGDWFCVQRAGSCAAYEWPDCEGRRVFTSAASLVADCGTLEVFDADDATAQAIAQAWPHRTIFGKPVRQPA